MNPYHVLAKITATSKDKNGVGSFAEQRHFFVKASCASSAVALAEMRVHLTEMEEVEIQFTVKAAVDRRSSGMEPGEEIYSL